MMNMSASAVTLRPQIGHFVIAYMGCGNATEAAVAAGYSVATAKQQGWRLLQRPDVIAQLQQHRRDIQRQQAMREERVALDGERTRREIARIAYFDPRQLFDAAGDIKPLHELDDDCAAAIGGFEVIETYAGSGAERKLVGRTWRYKFLPRVTALDMAARITGEYLTDNKQRPDVHSMTDQELFARALTLLGQLKPPSDVVVA